MAANLPSLDQITGARAGEYLADHQNQVQSYQSATNWNPHGEVGLSLGDGSALTWLEAIRATPWLDAHRASANTSTSYVEHGDALHEVYEREQSIPVLDLHFRLSEDLGSRHENEDYFGFNFLDNDQPRAFLTFPEGEDDAVTITATDLEVLRHKGILSNNIIDFYIKYLERSLSSDDRNRFYFFNSYFSLNLLGNTSAFADIGECEIFYQQVRKWSREVNLFEKDYVFIPVLRSSHWSLIVMVHLSGLTCPDKRKGSPRIFHLDPVEGKHENFEEPVRRYIIQAWMERYQAENNPSFLALCQMNYVEVKDPRQDIGYDCGSYLLHYVEVFLRESTSPDFSFASINGGPHFTSAHFAQEVSAKRIRIENLIFKLRENSEERAARRTDIHRPIALYANSPTDQPHRLRQPRKRLRKKWNSQETSVLLNHLVEGRRIRKGTEGTTHWDLISEDIRTKLGTIRSEGECRRRFDTSLKAYKKVKQTGKPFCDITAQERLRLMLATPLTEEWYKAIDRILLKRTIDNATSRKRAKLNLSDDNVMLALSPTIHHYHLFRLDARIQENFPENKLPYRDSVL